MKHLTSIVLLLLYSVAVDAQYTLERCKQLAHDNYPAVKQYRLIEQSRDYTVSNAAKGWLPQVGVNAMATWFTDITSTLDMDNALYNGSVQVTQPVYDGGSIAAQRRTARAQADVSTEQTRVALYNINSRVEQLFFGILAIDEQLAQNALLQNDLALSLNTVSGMMRGGIANQSDVDAVSVEQVRARQQEEGYRASRQAYVLMLSTFIGEKLSDTVTLAKPQQPNEYLRDVTNGNVGATLVDARTQQTHPQQMEHVFLAGDHEGRPYNAEETFNSSRPNEDVSRQETFNFQLSTFNSSRPELSYYAARDRLLDAERKALDVRLKPRLSAFGMGTYHNKVLAFMKNGFLAGGLTLSWNIGALYTRKNDIRNIEIEREMNAVERETFLFNTALETQNSGGVINSLHRQIALDDEIITLRRSICEKSERKVQNGTETVNELLRNINAVNEARSTKALHELQLLQEIYNLKNILNE